MSSLIDSLKAEHANIGRILAEVDQLGVDSEAGRMALLKAKKGLLAHIKHEDDNLYPLLLKEAETDPILADAMEFFNTDIEHVATVAMGFFEKYEAGDVNNSYRNDFAELIHVLTQRIKKEESVIYKMYLQLEM